MRSRLSNLLLPVLLCFACSAEAETLTLKECLERADRYNPALRAAVWDTRIAEQNVRQASSSYYPRVDAQLGYTIQDDAQAVKINGITAETQEPDYLFGGVAASYTIYDFGRRNARRQQARLQADAVESSFQVQRKDLSLQVIETYFGILQAERLITAAQEEVAQVEQHRRVAQALFEEGVVTRNDVLQAEVRLAAARQKLLSSNNHLQNRWLQINYLTGNPPTHRADLDDSANVTVVEEQMEEEGGFAERRYELQALRQELAAAEAGVQETKSAFFPELFTRFAVDYLENDKVREQTIMSATVGVKVNLFDGFTSSAARSRAMQIRSRIHDRLRQTKTGMQLEIDMANNDALVARERIDVAATAIRQGEENLRINRERYQERVGTATDVLDAQTLLTQIRTDHYRALFDYQVASARLQRALGEL